MFCIFLLLLGTTPAETAQPEFIIQNFALSPEDWEFSLEGGAQGSSSWTENSRTGKGAMLAENTNGIGSLNFRHLQRIPVKSGIEYESGVYFQLLDWQPLASMRFSVREISSTGEILAVHTSQHWSQLLKFAPENRWQRHWVRWTTGKNATEVEISLIITGNIVKMALDDFELIQSPKPLIHPLGGEVKEDPYDEQAAREVLARRENVSCSVQTTSNRPVFRVSDGYYAALLYKHHGYSKYIGYGKSGIHFHLCNASIPVTGKSDRVIDFEDTERNILEVLSGDPDGYVLLAINMRPSADWSSQNPDHVWMRENGEKPWIQRGGHPSYGSPVFREEVAQSLRQLGDFVKTSELGKVVVGFHFQGGNDGQFYEAVWSEMDHSPGCQQGFQEWLREVYKNDVDALRNAWGDDEVTFETAKICSEQERRSAPRFLRNKGKDQHIADSQRYWHLAPSRLLKYWAETLREAVGKPVVFTTWRPDAVHGHGTNTYAVSDLLSGENALDSTTGVQEYYEWRRLGGTGGINGTWGSHRLRDKVQICEIDYRTYRSYTHGEWHFEQLGATDTPEGFRAQIRRDVGAAAAHGMAAWYHDFAAWYDAEDLWSVLEESSRIMAWSHRPEAPAPDAKMAVFIDEQAASYINPRYFGMIWNAHNRQRHALNMSGVPYDIYFLDDIRHPKLPEYKLYIFLSSFTINREQIEAIKERCRQPGKVLVFMGAPGIATPDYHNVTDIAEELTDIHCELVPEGERIVSLPRTDSETPMTKNLSGSFIGSGSSEGNVLSPNDSDATVFGDFVLLNKPSHAVKHTGKGITVLMPTPQGFGGLTPQLVHNLAVLAGIKTLGTPGQATYVGCGVAVCHRVQPGPARVVFENPVDLIDLDGKTVLATGVITWEPDCDLLDTDAVFYHPTASSQR